MYLNKTVSRFVASAAVVVAMASASLAQGFNFTTLFAPDPIAIGGGFTIDIINGADNFVGTPSDINLANLELMDAGGALGTFVFDKDFDIFLTIDPLNPTAGVNQTKTIKGNLSGSVTREALEENGGVITIKTTNDIVFTPVGQFPLNFNFNNGLTFTVATPSDTPFGTSGASTRGAIAARVTAAIPEPSEYAGMGMAGFALCGLMVRARRRKSAGTLAA